MFTIDFKHPIKVHFIGIGGISMSGLAEILLQRGFKVSGSDAKQSELTDKLAAQGAEIFIGQRAENIRGDIDCVVYTAAIHPDNPEYAAAAAAGIPMMPRADLLGQLMHNYTPALAISGTHGKTTVTSMITEILLAAKNDATILVGGMLDAIGGNYHIGTSDTFVTEACEYTNSFLSFFPTIELILNVEADHLDFFKDIDDIRNSFRLFAEKLPGDGLLILNKSIARPEELTANVKCPIVTYGEAEGADYTAKNVSFDEMGRGGYDLYVRGEYMGRIQLGVFGEHNVENSLSAIAAAEHLGIGLDICREALFNFTGPHRRFEKKGELNGFTIIDDYAHHPDEIRATLTAAKRYPHKTLWCLFQSHTYTRTKALLPEFAEALSLADKVIVAPIYPARETDTLGMSGESIAELVRAKGVDSWALEDFESIKKFVLENCQEGDLLITMGAGDIVKVGDELLKH